MSGLPFQSNPTALRFFDFDQHVVEGGIGHAVRLFGVAEREVRKVLVATLDEVIRGPTALRCHGSGDDASPCAFLFSGEWKRRLKNKKKEVYYLFQMQKRREKVQYSERNRQKRL